MAHTCTRVGFADTHQILQILLLRLNGFTCYMYVHVHVTCKVMKVQCKSQMLIACEQTLASFANALIHQSVKPESRVWVKNPNTVYNTRTCLQAKILHVHVHVNIILVHKSMLMGQLHTYNIKPSCRQSINNRIE